MPSLFRNLQVHGMPFTVKRQTPLVSYGIAMLVMFRELILPATISVKLTEN